MVGVVAAGLLAAPASAGEPAASTSESTAAPARVIRLSDERKLTRWGTPMRRNGIYAAPAVGARPVGRLRFFTEDRTPEVYLALALATNRYGTWLRIRIPGRPNGRSGWVRRAAFGDLVTNRHRIEIDRRSLHIRLFRDGRRVFTARVGIGAPLTPTPGGRFWIREKLRFKSSKLYGRFALGTAAYAPTLSEWPGGGVIGIHGTAFPSLIPGRPSHGCIRMRNASMARLWLMTPLGTPVRIR